MIKRLLSYLLPIPIKIFPSKVSDQLELTWNNGKLVLDTKHTNYSYGNLQKVLRKGLLKIGKENINQMQSILILGVAGGSVIRTLTNEFQFQNKITGIEIDPVVLKIAEQYFKINEISNLELILADANVFVSQTTEIYDLIVIDIFQDCHMPDFLYSENFVSNIKKILKPKGYILFNTIVLNKTSEQKNKSFKNHFESSKFAFKSFPNIDDKNELFLIKKEYE